jgi:hypothetical protein
LNEFSDVDSLSTLSTEELSNNTDVIDQNDEENDGNNDGILLQNNQERETLVRNDIPQTSMYFL